MKKPIDIMLDTIQWEKEDIHEHEHGSDLPFPTHKGVLEIGGGKLRCYQLNTGERVFDAEDIHKFFGLNEHAQELRYNTMAECITEVGEESER